MLLMYTPLCLNESCESSSESEEEIETEIITETNSFMDDLLII